MKKIVLSLSLFSIALSTVGCSNNSSITQGDLTQSVNISSTAKADLSQFNFKDTAFSKFAAKKSKNSYKIDASVFNKKPVKNGLLDNLFGSKDFPFKSFFDFDKFIAATDAEYDYNNKGTLHYASTFSYDPREVLYDKVTAKSHFDKNLNAYLTAHEMYKSTKKQMERFILLDTLANSLTETPYMETHNPPFQPNYKIKPTEAAAIMPAFADIGNYNIFGKNNPHVDWNWTKAKQFYHDNYARYMGMIMEFSPKKEDAYSLIHKEISEAAWTGK